ncbi:MULTISPECIES: putative toxin-antitoxin system toxin component, PIN family [unclassified Rhizobium]|jgi:putative PIN family toxin of toxin-antitoxin system|uniref:putative toxin-antitoxin system toxin component, PIN family n=1 Tax=unclassified Rhizobium TaxID=2613769 RepID=UPI001607D279|nr:MULTISPECIES: putative toxin-antitoxin system toxin component, PIN family [unclassified Rhizobium]MBB3287306.1 putative PIN family toxin of toxin-antitoxin system [Rhizobium sp. BK252]MBB3402046.1 putative PIN family toxin of toxin-antitoxin system [Rhizobium sp. BK289]MBB3414623.1 putative PIN family toxin of toxin-antitoxin system [Rhizobium sp. BK284]MBB3482512.1 putative PIN family toxin of toxin-antitoxin system [Rhizobium sp. BK347]MDK4721281.1 putative toxin-antitoxin system toxin co
MKVVIDTNIFVSAIMNADGAPRQVIRLCLEERLVPLISNALFVEYEDVCGRDVLFDDRFISKEERITLLDAFLSSCVWTPIYYLWRPNLRDEGDNHLVELAVGGGASALITANKKDFAQAELLFPQLEIHTAGEFLIRRKL